MVGVLVNVIDPRSIEGAGAANDSVNLVSFGKQQLRKVGAILSGDAGNERAFHVFGLLGIAPSDLKTPHPRPIIGFHRQMALADTSWLTQRVLPSTDDLEPSPDHPSSARWGLRIMIIRKPWFDVVGSMFSKSIGAQNQARDGLALEISQRAAHRRGNLFSGDHWGLASELRSQM
jgi:hypothetical protein